MLTLQMQTFLFLKVKIQNLKTETNTFQLVPEAYTTFTMEDYGKSMLGATRQNVSVS